MSETTTSVVDLNIRQHALDTTQSFIVQAPAGSGKTELLTQRYLKLLGQASQSPEEIVAITFTKKAANEMKSRILGALQAAAKQLPVNSPHQQVTQQLAQAVLQKDAELQWNLLQNANRLRIQTIDSLCAYLTRQMPLLSEFGVLPEISEDCQELYADAVNELLAHLEESLPWTPAIETILLYLDNDLEKVKGLLIAMLRCREQWLPHLTRIEPEALRQTLQAAFAVVITEHLATLQDLFTAIDSTTLLNCLQFAAHHLIQQGMTTPLTHCRDLQTIPGHQLEDLVAWLGISELLLTKTGDWRQRLDKKCGFPPASDARNADQKQQLTSMKQVMKAFLDSLREQDNLRLALNQLNNLPAPDYQETEWQVIDALITLLPILAAQLIVTFRAQGQVDFTQISLAANHALGEINNPSDLALRLDYQIRHILLDEFQDTSVSQFRLLEQLTAGWESADGRTLFLVGDPMQSIYRFRQAEVGLFIKAWEQGVGDIQLTPLKLQVNFRSTQTIVKWVNETFCTIFPKVSDMSTGAIAYSESTPFQQESQMGEVKFHPIFNTSESPSHEGNIIVQLIQQVRQNNPQRSIAILVRARTHLRHILPILQQAEIAYQAVEIEQLFTRPIIQDLWMLTRALLHLADRIAWLALLRAPWCGLTLDDLYLLAGQETNHTIWELLNTPEVVCRLSADGQQRLQRILPFLAHSIKQRLRQDFRCRVENLWLNLSGPGFYQQASDITDSMAYFNLLSSVERSRDIPNLRLLENKLLSLYASPNYDNRMPPVQVMTIHKSKGLEFDTVIIPGLQAAGARDDLPILAWMERPRHDGAIDLLLAPISTGKNKEPCFQYIRQQNQQKARFETTRLLYVAATRAKQQLHLIANISIDEQQASVKKPSSSSLLSLLWDKLYPQVEAELLQNALKISPIKDPFTAPTLPVQPPSLMRLTSQSLHHPSSLIQETDESVTLPNIQMKLTSLANDTQRHIGILVHRIIKLLGEHGWQSWQATDFAEKTNYYRTALAQMGVPPANLTSATNTVIQALTQMMNDPRGQWILDHQHHDSQTEYPVTLQHDGEFKNYIIDRTFVEENTRWIIDYKITYPEHLSVEKFIQQERQRYQQQLENYAHVLQLMDNRPIKLGLYFPLLPEWHEWHYLPSQSEHNNEY